VSYGEDSCSLLEMLLVLGFTHGSKALVLDELVLDVLMFANRAPWRDGGGGGGGGDLTPSIGS
jgi:hypothetical protein